VKVGAASHPVWAGETESWPRGAYLAAPLVAYENRRVHHGTSNPTHSQKEEVVMTREPDSTAARAAA
jgi:hypothetical protein